MKELFQFLKSSISHHIRMKTERVNSGNKHFHTMTHNLGNEPEITILVRITPNRITDDPDVRLLSKRN